MDDDFRYKDILYHPHREPEGRMRMPRSDRAAQFASFKALEGYEESVAEAGRLVPERPVLDEDAAAELDGKVQYLRREGAGDDIKVTYFAADGKKAGGTLRTAVGTFRRIDDAEGMLVMTDGTRLPLHDIYDIEMRNS